MPAILENIDTNKVKLTISITPEQFEEGMKHAYNINKGRISLPGFRPGKAPRKLIEVQYGKEIFYEDAIDHVLPGLYADAVTENKLNVVSKPEIDIIEASAEKGAVCEFVFYIKPTAKVMDYTGLKYKEYDKTVNEDEITAEIDKAREQNSRIIDIVDRAVQNGDRVDIDFEGFIDGVAFEGGKAAGHELVIGSHSFIDTFEEQLIGRNIGDEAEVNVKFPDDYNAEELKGKPAVFKVKINGIKYKEIPEANDDFAQDVSEFNTLKEYKDDIKAKLEHEKEHKAERDMEDQLVDRLIERTIVEIPKPMIESQIDSMVRDFEERVKSTGLPLETYLAYMQMDMAALRGGYRANAEKNIKARLALETVADMAEVTASDDDISEEIRKMSEVYGIEKDKLEKVMSESDRENIVKDVRVQKALRLIVDSSVKEVPAVDTESKDGSEKVESASKKAETDSKKDEADSKIDEADSKIEEKTSKKKEAVKEDIKEKETDAKDTKKAKETKKVKE